MLRCLLLLVALVGSLGVAPSSAQAAGPGVGRMLLTATAHPARSQFVSWSSSRPQSGQRVQFRRPGGRVRSAVARRQPDLAGTARYTARLTGLRADTAYRYRIATRSGKTRWRTFRTAPKRGGAFTFLQFGDTQVDNAGVPARIVRRAVRRHPDARLLLHAGDAVNDARSAGEWRQLHRALGPAGRHRSWIAALGNHDQCPLYRCSFTGGQSFRSYFRAPVNGVAGQRRTWFHVDAGAARFIVLDAFGSDLERQRAFLARALRTNRRAWSIVLLHAGPFASRADRSNARWREALLPTLERHGADLVLSGHDHSYARGSKAGVAYVTSVSGAKYYGSSALDWTAGGAKQVASAAGTATYQVVTVTPRRLTVRAIVAHRGSGSTARARVGQTLDAFTLRR